MNCKNCGKELDNYEIKLKEDNQWENGYCVKCLKKADLEQEELLRAESGY